MNMMTIFGTTVPHFNTFPNFPPQCMLPTAAAHCEKGKAVPLQAWTGPKGSQEFKLPRFHDNGTGWW